MRDINWEHRHVIVMLAFPDESKYLKDVVIDPESVGRTYNL